MFADEEMIALRRKWISNYPRECREKSMTWYTASYEPPWVQKPMPRSSIDYEVENQAFYPPWTTNLAKAKLEAYLEAGDFSIAPPRIDKLAKEFLADAAFDVTRDTPATNIPLRLVQYITDASARLGLEIASGPSEWDDGECSGALLKPLPTHLPIVTTASDADRELAALGIGILWRVVYSNRSARYPTWFLLGQFWREEDFKNTPWYRNFIEQFPGDLKSLHPFQAYLQLGMESGTFYQIEETLNEEGARRVLDLVLDLLHGRKAFPKPIERGYGASTTDIVQAASEAVGALAAAGSLIYQIRMNRQRSNNETAPKKTSNIRSKKTGPKRSGKSTSPKKRPNRKRLGDSAESKEKEIGEE